MAKIWLNINYHSKDSDFCVHALLSLFDLVFVLALKNKHFPEGRLQFVQNLSLFVEFNQFVVHDAVQLN